MMIIAAILLLNCLCITSQNSCNTITKPCHKKLNNFCCERPPDIYKNDPQSKICCDFGIKKDSVPSFQWRSTDDGSQQIEVNSDLYWNGEFEIDLKLGSSYSDIAILKPFRSRFMNKFRGDKRRNECILKGYLRIDKNIPVTVSGCPFNDTFQIIIPNIKLLGNSIFLVNKGKVTPYDGYPNGRSSVIVDDVITSDIDVSGFKRASRKIDLNKKYVPETFELTMSLRYDSLFLENVCAGNHECAMDKVATIATLAETYYQAPDALGTKVTFFVTEINHARTEMRLEGGDFGTYIPVGEAEYFSEKNPLSVDHYHYFTHDEIREKDTTGVARVLRLDYGNGEKSKNSGSFCLDDQMHRFAISEYRGSIDDWDIQKLGAVTTMAHEIGHALGMPHDFINEKPRFDSKGQNCTAMNGIMSYEKNRSSWSTCSKESMNGWFGELQYVGMDCWNRRVKQSISANTTPISPQSTKFRF